MTKVTKGHIVTINQKIISHLYAVIKGSIVVATQLQPLSNFYAVSIFKLVKDFHRELTADLVGLVI
ncbi:MAG: hypothetical protein LBM87_01945 [Ruminococcus sp.]|nr:hypothetical protein [Ruminococcus sp.]